MFSWCCCWLLWLSSLCPPSSWSRTMIHPPAWWGMCHFIAHPSPPEGRANCCFLSFCISFESWNDPGSSRIRRWHLSAYLNTTANIITFQFYNLFKSISRQCISQCAIFRRSVNRTENMGEKAESWNSSPLWKGTQLPKINEWDRFLEAEIGS